MMESMKTFLIPLIISNVVFAITIIAAFKKPFAARIFYVILFFWAAYTNYSTVNADPNVYLEYGNMAILPFYKDFIYGFFSQHTTIIVTVIAGCQFLIGIGLILNKNWLKLAYSGAIIFGLAIAPLGIGSGFPSTILMAISCYVLFKNPNCDYVWKTRQYAQEKRVHIGQIL